MTQQRKKVSNIRKINILYELKQLISVSTHILQHPPIDIDLIFDNQPNLVIDSGIHPSLHQNCHYQVIFCKLNLKLSISHLMFTESATDQFDEANLFLDKNINELLIQSNHTKHLPKLYSKQNNFMGWKGNIVLQNNNKTLDTTTWKSFYKTTNIASWRLQWELCEQGVARNSNVHTLDMTPFYLLLLVISI